MTLPDRPTPAVRRRDNNHRRTRRYLPYGGAVLIGGLLVWGFWPNPLPVEMGTASVGQFRVSVSEEGKTRIKQRFLIAAPVAGQLRRIPFKAGAEIKAADIVAIIDPGSPSLLDVRSRAATEAKRDAAAASLAKAQAARSFAASERRRFERLFKEKMVSTQDLEAAQMRDETAAKEEAATQSALRQVEAELAQAGGGASTDGESCVPQEVKSPVDGRVLRVFEESARVVAAGAPLVEIGDPADLEVVVEVLSRDGAVIAPGAKVEFEQWGGSEPLVGRVRLVEPAAFTKISALGVEEQRVNVIADLTTPAEERRNVGDNFRVEANIIVWEAGNVLKVPMGALFRRGDQWAAFVLVDDRAQLRIVKTGHMSATDAQVLEGLKPGERVILYPGSRVHEGKRVRPVSI